MAFLWRSTPTDAYAAKLKAAAPNQTLAGIIRAHLDQLKAGDYFATVAFLPMFEEHEAAIQQFRAIRNVGSR